MGREPKPERTYLGDGVYVQIEEGGMFKLTTDYGGETNTIYLGPSVYAQLKRFASLALSPKAPREDL